MRILLAPFQGILSETWVQSSNLIVLIFLHHCYSFDILHICLNSRFAYEQSFFFFSPTFSVELLGLVSLRSLKVTLLLLLRKFLYCGLIYCVQMEHYLDACLGNSFRHWGANLMSVWLSRLSFDVMFFAPVHFCLNVMLNVKRLLPYVVVLFLIFNYCSLRNVFALWCTHEFLLLICVSLCGLIYYFFWWNFFH